MVTLSFAVVYKNVDIDHKVRIEHLFKSICKKTVSLLKLKNDLLFDVTITNNKHMKEINSSYRNVDRATDVLTFAFHDIKPETNLLGEIFINWEDVKKDSSYKELCLLFVHGLLHLLKFNHESASGYKQMTQLQDLILSKLNFNITIE